MVILGVTLGAYSLSQTSEPDIYLTSKQLFLKIYD